MLQYPAPPINPKTLATFASGTGIHERHQDMWSKMGILIVSELKLNYESKNEWTREQCKRLRINGRLDAIIRIAKKICIAEIKSAKESSFQRMIKDDPYEAYLDQMMLYMYLTQIGSGILFVENKNNQEIHEFPYAFDEIRARKIVDHINLINEHVVNLTLPPRDAKAPTFTCKRLCDYSEACWDKDKPIEQYIEKHHDEIQALITEQTPKDWRIT
jgi:hypothetical protein